MAFLRWLDQTLDSVGLWPLIAVASIMATGLLILFWLW